MDTDLPFRGSEAVRSGELTRGALRGPGFRRVGHDVYLGAAVPDSPLLAVRAALVGAGPGAVATGWSACLAFGLDVARDARPVEITVGARRVRMGGGVLVRQQVLAAEEVMEVDGVRVTTELRTAYDLARRSGPVSSAVDRVLDPLSDAVVAADALARSGGFSGADLAGFAAVRPGRHEVRRVAVVAALLDPLAESPPETRARLKVVLAGLPRPVAQYEVRDAFGTFVARTDLAWPEFRVAVEYDGRDHAQSDRRGRDLDRLDALRRAGWVVIVLTARQLARPRWLPDRVFEELQARGWHPSGDNEWAHLLQANADRA